MAEREVADAVGVHEVEALVGEAVEQGGALRRLDGVPAHVRQDRRLELLDDAGPLTAAVGVAAVLDAALEQDLHADADAQHGAAAGEAPADDLRSVDGTEPLHAGGESTHPRNDEAVGVQGGLRVRRHGHVGADAGERPLGRPQVARPVVEDDHLLHAAHGTCQRITCFVDSRRRRCRASQGRGARGRRHLG